MLFNSCKQCYVSSISIGHFLSIGIGLAGENRHRCITNLTLIKTLYLLHTVATKT